MKPLLALLLLASLCLAQTPEQETPAQQERPVVPAVQPAPPEPKPYDKVVTKEAKTKAGVFLVHQVKEKWYYEIPQSELNKEFLWVSQIARTTLGSGYGGQALGSRVVRWERNHNKVLLRDIKYDVVADHKEPIAQAVKAQVARILDPKFASPAPAPRAPFPGLDDWDQPSACWPDYGIGFAPRR